jgi:sec-independent protein translocase protein TatC
MKFSRPPWRGPKSLTERNRILFARPSDLTHSAESERALIFLDDLRKTLIYIAISVLISSAGGYVVAGHVLRFLQRIAQVQLVAFGIPEAFFGFLELALGIGILISMPFILYRMLMLLPKRFPSMSRKVIAGFWLIAVVLFYTGVIFCLKITLPYGIQFLLSFETPTIKPVISVGRFLSFCLLFLFGFGLVFEVPVAMVLMGRLLPIDVKTLSRYRRYALLAITIVSAVLTPTPDVFNLTLMAVPLYLLFEIGLIGMRLTKK